MRSRKNVIKYPMKPTSKNTNLKVNLWWCMYGDFKDKRVLFLKKMR